MNALTTTNAELPTLSDLAISTPLWRLLSSEAPAEVEIAEIVANPALHQLAIAHAGELAIIAQPCGERAVRHALQSLVLVYGVGDAARAPAFWAPYMQTLRDLPAEALQAAVAEYVASPDAQFFPKPGPLRALGEKHAAPLRRAASRAATAARMKAERQRPEPTDESRAQVRRMLGEMSEAMERKRLDAPTTPTWNPPPPRTDEAGITPQMRALIERREQSA